MNKSDAAMLEKFKICIDTDLPLNGGEYPIFSYGYKGWLDDNWFHGVEDHAHLENIAKRPCARFSIRPPFLFDAFESKVKEIQKIWKGRRGNFEFEGSDDGTSPFNGVTGAFFTPIGVDSELDEGDRSITYDISKSYCLVAYTHAGNDLIGVVSPNRRNLSNRVNLSV